MTQNAWNSDYPNADGEVIIGNGSGKSVSSTLTASTNVTITNSAGGIQVDVSPISDWVIMQSDTASSTAYIDYTCGISDFEMLVLVGNNQSSANQTGLGVALSTNGGSSYDTTSGNYNGSGWEMFTGSYTALDDTTISKLQILGTTTAPPGNSTNQTASFVIKIFKPSNSQWTKSVCYSYYTDNSGNPGVQYWGSFYKNTTAVNAMRLVQSSGNISTGDFILYGVAT